MRSNFVSALIFDLLTAVLLKILFSWDAVLRLLTSRKLSQCHRLQGQAASLHACARTHSHQHTTVLFWIWTSIYDSCYRHVPQVPNLWHALSFPWHASSFPWHALSFPWHAVSFPWHAEFAAVPVFVFALPTSLYCEECVYIYISDCVQTVYELRSVYWRRYSLNGPHFESRQRQEIFLLSITSTPVLGPTQPLLSRHRGLFPRR